MVRREGLSKGCQQCRKRKIRCDQGRPECARCIKIGMKCPGYRNLQDEIFRPYEHKKERESSTSTTASRSSSHAGPSSKTKSDTTVVVFAKTDSTRSSPSRVSPVSMRPAPQDSPSWDNFALAYFVSQYTSSEQSPFTLWKGWFEFVPDLLTTDLCLKPAVEAVAWAHLAHQSRTPWAAVQARRCYSTAVEKLNTALEKHETAIKDDTLAASMILGLHDNRTGDPSFMDSHLKGCVALVNLRGKEVHKTSIGRSLYRHVRALSRVRELEYGVSPFISDWIRETAGSDDFQHLGWASTSIARYIQKVKLGTNFEALLEEGQKFDRRLQAWANSNPVGLGVKLSGDVETPAGYLLIYDSIWNYGFSQLYRACRLYVLEAIYFLSESLKAEDELFLSSIAKDAFEDCQTLIDEICAAMPSALGEVDLNGRATYKLPKNLVMTFLSTLWLRAAKTCPFARPDQRQYVKDTQARIAMLLGIENKQQPDFLRSLKPGTGKNSPIYDHLNILSGEL